MNNNCKFWYVMFGILLGIIIVELTVITVKLYQSTELSQRKLDSIITTLDTWELDK